MIIDCISDLHGFYPKLEGGDLLIVAGDLTARDEEKEWVKFETWLFNQKYKQKIIVAGNHDNFMQSMDEHRVWKYWNRIPHVTYLCDSGTKFENLKIWGTPWTKTFKGMNPHCKAFTVDTEEELADKIEMIPQDTDILITHSLPWTILDKTVAGRHAGSTHLFGYIKYACRPKLHVFGHIHEAYGQIEHFTGCISVNASHVNEKYQPVNKPIRVIL